MGVLEPNVYTHLLRERDEEVQDIVEKHPLAHWVSVLDVLAALAMLGLMALGPAQLSLFSFSLAAALLLHAVWRFVVVRRDRLVITNLRVFG